MNSPQKRLSWRREQITRTMTMEIQSQFFATCQRTRKPAPTPLPGSTTPRKAAAHDSFMGNAPETTRTSSTRGESAEMLVDRLQDLMCQRKKETTIRLTTFLVTRINV